MDPIDSLALDDSPLTTKESYVMERYFQEKGEKLADASKDLSIRQAAYFTLLFVLLNNPLSDRLFYMVASENIRYIIKLVTFFTLAYAIILLTT